jgi:hypothetical protein
MPDLGFMLVNKLRGRPADAPLTGPVPAPIPAPPLTEREASIEKRRMMTVLPGETQKFVEDILAWARAQGIPCILGETHRSEEEQKEIAKEGKKTTIPEGKTGWHQYGRAFHLILYKPGTKQIDPEAYKIVGAEVRRRGGEWLGDRLLKTPKGEMIQDLAHFEYHPGLKLSSYRDTALAKREMKIVDRRAARYG